MRALTSTQLSAIADEAYGVGVSTNSEFHAGVEAFARYLLGKGTDPRMAELLRDVARSGQITADYNAHRGQQV